MERKFEVGDRVRVVRGGSNRYFSEGAEGVIYSAINSGHAWVTFDKGNYMVGDGPRPTEWCVATQRLELVETPSPNPMIKEFEELVKAHQWEDAGILLGQYLNELVADHCTAEDPNREEFLDGLEGELDW